MGFLLVYVVLWGSIEHHMGFVGFRSLQLPRGHSENLPPCDAMKVYLTLWVGWLREGLSYMSVPLFHPR